MPGIGSLITGLRGAGRSGQDEDGGVVLVCFLLGVFGDAERGADEHRGVALRIVGLREIDPEFAAGERRVDGRRQDRQQGEQQQEDLRKAAMEAGPTQNEPLRSNSGCFTFEGGSRHVKRPASPADESRSCPEEWCTNSDSSPSRHSRESGNLLSGLNATRSRFRGNDGLGESGRVTQTGEGRWTIATSGAAG
jgi:hypothetical protein